MDLTVDREGGVLNTRKYVFNMQGVAELQHEGVLGLVVNVQNNRPCSTMATRGLWPVVPWLTLSARTFGVSHGRNDWSMEVKCRKRLILRKIVRRLFSCFFLSPALVILHMPVVRVVRPVRYPPAVVRDHDKGVRQVAWRREGR